MAKKKESSFRQLAGSIRHDRNLQYCELLAEELSRAGLKVTGATLDSTGHALFDSIRIHMKRKGHAFQIRPSATGGSVTVSMPVFVGHAVFRNVRRLEHVQEAMDTLIRECESLRAKEA